uniref:Uncharacterized protein n=1 Tax=Amphimedon queenslandica TaxID=400682 RepID=A0A1X7TET3_AMPQE
MVVLGVKMIYDPLLPGHKKRLTQTMKSLLAKSVSAQSTYVDLTLSFNNDLPGPPVRYYFKIIIIEQIKIV